MIRNFGPDHERQCDQEIGLDLSDIGLVLSFTRMAVCGKESAP